MKTTLIWGVTNEHLIQDISLSDAKLKRVNDLGLEKINLARANPWLLSSSYIWKYLLGSLYNKDIKAGIFTVSQSSLLVFLHCSEFTSPDDSDVQGVSLYRCAVIISASCKAGSSTEISVNSFLRLLGLLGFPVSANHALLTLALKSQKIKWCLLWRLLPRQTRYKIFMKISFFF